MKEHYQELQELFSLDHLLLFIVGYVCPKSDIAEFCVHIHIPYAIALVCRRLEKYHSLSHPSITEVKWAINIEIVIITVFMHLCF